MSIDVAKNAITAILHSAESMPPAPVTPDALVDQHLDAVLRASGSALRFYSMQSTLDGMRSAMRAAMLAGAALLTGCATAPMQYTPVVDRPGPSYDADLADCRALAAQRDPVATAGAGVAVGALAGAVLGAAIGGRGAIGLGARIGAGEGLIGGAAHGLVQQRVIVMSCLIGRGHRVIA